MSTAIIVDSACDLPEHLLKSRAIQVIPLNLCMNGRKVSDRFTPAQRLRFMEDGTISLKNEDYSAPSTKEQMIDFLKEKILPSFDFAMVQTVAKARSPQFQLWHEVNMAFQSRYREYRRSDQTFILRTADTGTMFTGQGLMALNTIHLAKQKLARRTLLEQSRDFARHIQSYSAPADLLYIRQRGYQKGERSVSYMSALMGKTMSITPILYGGQNQTAAVGKLKGQTNAINRIIEHAINAIHAGLKSPHISIAYGGPLHELDKFERMAELKEVANEHGVEVSTSVATLSTVINMGPKNFSLAVAPNDPDYRLSVAS